MLLLQFYFLTCALVLLVHTGIHWAWPFRALAVFNSLTFFQNDFESLAGVHFPKHFQAENYWCCAGNVFQFQFMLCCGGTTQLAVQVATTARPHSPAWSHLRLLDQRSLHACAVPNLIQQHSTTVWSCLQPGNSHSCIVFAHRICTLQKETQREAHELHQRPSSP